MKKFILFASIIFVSNIMCMDNNQMEITKDQIDVQQRKARDPILEKHKEIIQYHTELIEKINTLTALSDEKDKRISDLEQELAKNKEQIQQITEEKRQKDEQIELLQKQIETLQQENDALNNKIKENQEFINKSINLTQSATTRIDSQQEQLNTSNILPTANSTMQQ